MQVTRHAERTTVEAEEGIRLAHLGQGSEMNLQYFEVRPGDRLPMHSHRHEQAGYVFNGTLTFVLADGEEVVVEAGDAYIIPADQAHATENRGEDPADGLDVFSPPRENLDWAEDTYHELVE